MVDNLRRDHLFDPGIAFANDSEAAKPSGEITTAEQVSVLDERQLIRIEAVHRGFLYQPIYGAICLLGQQPALTR